MRPKSRSRVVSALLPRDAAPAAARDGRPVRRAGFARSAYAKFGLAVRGDLGRLFNRRVLRFRESTGTNRLSDMQFESISEPFRSRRVRSSGTRRKRGVVPVSRVSTRV